MPYKDIDTRRSKNREYQRKHYSENKQYYKDKASQRRAGVRAEFNELKAKLSCNRCGESHIACLDFHHTSPSEKEVSVSSAVGMSWSIERIKKEIEKCEVLCSNCHRKEHYCGVEQSGSSPAS